MDEMILGDLRTPLSENEFKLLDDFLMSDATPDDCMDIATLDGFLTALAIGPNTVMPSKWLPFVWDEENGGEMIWETIEQAQHIMGLIHRLSNSIINTFQTNPEMLQPVFYESTSEDGPIPVYEEWCVGFMRAVDLSFDDWHPLVDSEEDKKMLTPLILFGTEEGWKILEEQGEAMGVPYEDWDDMIRLSVVSVHKYWSPFRQVHHEVKQQAIGQKIGRNEPCPCGSGRSLRNVVWTNYASTKHNARTNYLCYLRLSII